MTNIQYFWIFTLLGAVLEIAGDYYFKRWSLGGSKPVLFFGFILYTLGAGFWALSLKHETLSKAITIFTILNLIVVVLLGVVFFKENLTIYHKLGIFFGVLSIFLLEL